MTRWEGSRSRALTLAHGICVVALVGALSLSACGDRGSSAEADAFIRDADAICSRIDGRFQEVISEPNALGKVYPEVREGVRQLRALEPPSEFAESYGRYLRATNSTYQLLEEAVRDPRKQSDPKAIEAQRRARELRREAARAAREIGFRVCA